MTARPPRSAWAPLGWALTAYVDGATKAELVVRTDAGGREDVPVSLFFRTRRDMPACERRALDEAKGRVLDVGAGAGAHALALQRAGMEVAALEPLPAAAEVLRRRGVRKVHVGGLDAVSGRRYDTILLLMNGVGLAGTLSALPGFLGSVAALMSPGGQVLMDSTDPRLWVDSHAREEGRYPGELHYQLEFRGRKGPAYPFLFLDPESLEAVARRLRLECDVLETERDGRYLARLVGWGPASTARSSTRPGTTASLPNRSRS